MLAALDEICLYLGLRQDEYLDLLDRYPATVAEAFRDPSAIKALWTLCQPRTVDSP